MSFRIDDEKLLEKYKVTLTKLEDLKNIELKALPVYDGRYIKTKIKTYSDELYTNYRGLNVPEDHTGCGIFYSRFYLLVYKNKYYLQVYLDNCAYKIANKQMKDYLNDNLFEHQIL